MLLLSESVEEDEGLAPGPTAGTRLLDLLPHTRSVRLVPPEAGRC